MYKTINLGWIFAKRNKNTVFVIVQFLKLHVDFMQQRYICPRLPVPKSNDQQLKIAARGFHHSSNYWGASEFISTNLLKELYMPYLNFEIPRSNGSQKTRETEWS